MIFKVFNHPIFCFYRLFPLVEFRIDLANEGIMRIWPISQKFRKWSTHEPTYPWKSGALRNQSIVITNYSLWRMLVNSCITRILVNKQTNDMFLLQSASFLDFWMIANRMLFQTIPTIEMAYWQNIFLIDKNISKCWHWIETYSRVFS